MPDSTDTTDSTDRERTTQQELLSELQRLSEKLDRVPTFQDMDEHGKYSGALYHVRFDSWTNALNEVGLDPNDRKITNDELTNELQRLSEELDKIPTTTDIENHGEYSKAIYYKRFGDWNSALEAANLDSSHLSSNLDQPERKQNLLNDLVELAEDLGHIPKQKEIREYTPHSHSTYYHYWGGVQAALEASDADLDEIDTTRKTVPRSIETEELLEELQRLAEKVGRPPKWVDIRKHGKYSDNPYRSRFNSLEDAHRAAGIPTEY